MVNIPMSYQDIPQQEAIKMCDELCKLFFEAGAQFDLVTLHQVGKQLISLYFDSKNSRYEIAEHLIVLQFLEFAVKIMKKLNNYGVFKGDDVWFATFYLYNICWNYAEVNPSFASGLVKNGLEHLLISNIMHDPYIDNLSKKNVNYLIKATLHIIYNVLRVPGNRVYLSSDNVIKGLLKVAAKDEKLSVLSTMCLSYIACSDLIESTPDFDIFYNTKLIFYYIKIASENGGKYNGYNLSEFIEVLKFGSLSTIQKEAIIKLDGVEVFIELLNSAKDDKLRRDILLTLVNLLNSHNQTRLLQIANFFVTSKSLTVSEAAKTLIWAVEIRDNKSADNNNNQNNGKGIFINFARRDLEIAKKIDEHLSDLLRPSLVSCENNIDMLRKLYDEASVIILCVSEAFRGTIPFKIGSEYCLLKNKIIFPVLVQNNYKCEGWIKDFTAEVSDVMFNLSTNVESVLNSFLSAINNQIDSLNNEAIPKMIENTQSNRISEWLIEQNLVDLKPKLNDLDMNMIFYMKKVRSEAPEFYFRSLENGLKLSLMEILKLSAALDRLN